MVVGAPFRGFACIAADSSTADGRAVDVVDAQERARLRHWRKHAQLTGMSWYRTGPPCGLGGVARGGRQGRTGAGAGAGMVRRRQRGQGTAGNRGVAAVSAGERSG